MHAFVTSVRFSRAAARGFTLIELMIVMLIAAVLIAVGAPALGEFVADQRVRTAASDIAGEIAYARAKAIENSRRVFFQRTGATWAAGWRIFVDLNNNSAFDAGEELKVFNGFPPGSMYLCSTVAEFANSVIFRPDGRVVRTTGVGANDGIFVVDPMGDAALCNNKIRGLLFGVSGRPTAVALKGTTPPVCIELTPPC